jgi:hypothetical protein
MLVSIAERIGAPIGATTCPLRVTATTHTAVLEIAVTIQPMSGSATTDSGGTTDSLTLRGGHVWDAPYQQAIENMVLPFDGHLVFDDPFNFARTLGAPVAPVHSNPVPA